MTVNLENKNKIEKKPNIIKDSVENSINVNDYSIEIDNKNIENMEMKESKSIKKIPPILIKVSYIIFLNYILK